ncbi:anthranilate synthase component 1 [Candidatus Woesearchaeota archaeon]|nr:anthranilate synthase component 1 [Candidatus Woesearchaeota archaeon]|tara:strand:+ start:78 stop:1664 length:1587 start_codon:yes stop_codon:yes gene_type:complete
MQQAKNLIKSAKIGSIVPVVETLPYALDPVDYFAKLSDYGKKKNSILLESADIVPKYGERSLGSVDPCLKVEGKDEKFEITALNELGKKFIVFLKNEFDFCDKVEYKKDVIRGILKPKRNVVSEEERLQLTNHADIIRKIAFKFKPTIKPFIPYSGLFGCISYDFIDQFEDLPKNKKDITNDPDYVLYFLDNLFLIDHKENKTFFVSNALITDDGNSIYDECLSKIEGYKNAIKKKVKNGNNKNRTKQKIESDTSKEEFIELVKKVKRNIMAGDVYQTVLSRTISTNYIKEPLDIYKKLRKLNPSPYMFFINNSGGILLGASPEMTLRVQGDSKKIVEIRPIAGTKPRGLMGDKIDMDLDSRYETELKIDAKEISEHTMLVDLARNDVAKVSGPGTRYVNESLVVEKYSHVQHLVSNVKGTLKEGLDALHAYVATMNMGTLTGAPKVEAMKLIRKYEKTKRGFYGGTVCYITPNGDFDSAIIIRSIRIKGKKAYVRTGAGIVHDSDPESEYEETGRKASACLKVLGED